MEISNIIYGLVKAPLANSPRSHASARKNIARAAIKQPCYTLRWNKWRSRASPALI